MARYEILEASKFVSIQKRRKVIQNIEFLALSH